MFYIQKNSFLFLVIGLVVFICCKSKSNNTDKRPGNTISISSKDILFSIPTIENTFPNFENETTDSNLQIFEDDWRQIEFISSDYKSAIENEIDSIKKTIQSEASGYGFKNIYVRKSIPQPLSIPYKELVKSLGVKHVEQSGLNIFNNQGQVENGFSLICDGVKFYGLKNKNDTVTVLGIVGAESDEALYDFLKNIKQLLQSKKIVLVHWLHQAVLYENNIDQLVPHFEIK